MPSSNVVKWKKVSQGLYYHIDGKRLKKGDVISCTKEELGRNAYLFAQISGQNSAVKKEYENKQEPEVVIDINDLPELQVEEEANEETEEDLQEESEEDIFGEETEEKFSIVKRGKLSYVVNNETGEDVNKKGTSVAKAKELLDELLSNA